MKEYRIEAVADPATGLFYVEVFSAGASPIAKTRAIYSSREEAIRRVDEAIKTAFPAEPNAQLA